MDNKWNCELGVLSEIIRELSEIYENVEYLSLRENFISKLSSKNISDYIMKSAFSVIWDAMICRTPEQVDKRALARGLHFTLDGVHLNSAGAEIVAAEFLKIIMDD